MTKKFILANIRVQIMLKYNSIPAAAKAMGISYDILKRILNGSTNLTLDYILKLSEGLDIPPALFFDPNYRNSGRLTDIVDSQYKMIEFLQEKIKDFEN